MDRLVGWIARHPVAIVVSTVVLSIACALWSWQSLRLDADTNSLIGDNQPFMQQYRKFNREFGDLEFLMVVIDPKGDELAADSVVKELEVELRAIPDLPAVVGSVTPIEQFRLTAWSATDAALNDLHLSRGALGVLASRPGAGGVLQASAQRLEQLRREGESMTPDRQHSLAAEAFLLARCVLGGLDDAPESLATPRHEEWLQTHGGSLRLVLVMPMKNYDTLAVIEKPVQAIRSVMERVRRRHPSVEMGLTGRPVLQADEMSTTSRDMNLASATALGLCATLFMVVFRGVKRPLLAVSVFMAGAALTCGAATLLVGRLNLLSVVFMLVLVGVGLDYGIHMVARYLEGLRHLGCAASVRHMVRRAVPSVLAGAATSAGTFLIAMVAPMQGLRELGLISGVGLLLCALTMTVALPALLLLTDRNARRESLRRGFFENPLEGRVDRYDGRAGTPHWALVIASLVLAIAGGWVGWRQIRFENNLLRLQADGLESVEWQHRLQAAGSPETWFGACMVDSLNEIAPLVATAKQQPLIGNVRSVLDLVPVDSPARAEMRSNIGTASLAEPATQRHIATPESASRVESALAEILAVSSLASMSDADRAAFDGLRKDVGRLNTMLRRSPDQGVRASESAVARAGAAAEAIGQGARHSLREALPLAVRDTLTSNDGGFAVLLHPVEDVWAAEAMNRFVASLRRVDPLVTGVPITVYESMILMERSFFVQGLLASLWVALLLFVDFRCWKLTSLSMLSMMIGMSCTVGAMGLFGIAFNLANFFAIPIMIGLSIDSCIHVTHRAIDGGLQVGFGSTRRAVIVTALTTTIGFGMLLWAQHRGLRSLGQVMVLASLLCLVSSVWVLPALLRIAGLGRCQLRPVSIAP